MSRGPLREAMQLVQEGLVHSEHNRGLFVIRLEPDDVRDIYDARAAVERAAVALILRGDRNQAPAQLDAVHADMIAAAEVGDRAALSDADLRFHQALVGLAGSHRLNRMHGTLLVETRMCLTALQNSDRPAADAVAEHRGLIEAVRTGDKRRLNRLIDSHMEDAMRRLMP